MLAGDEAYLYKFIVNGEATTSFFPGRYNSQQKAKLESELLALGQKILAEFRPILISAFRAACPNYNQEAEPSLARALYIVIFFSFALIINCYSYRSCDSREHWKPACPS